MIKESLRGKKIAITGSTGFLGTALVELLLREIDDVQIRLLIRPSGKRSAEKRLERDILRNNAFDSLRSSLGNEDFDHLTNSQIKTLPAAVSYTHLTLPTSDLV